MWYSSTIPFPARMACECSKLSVKSAASYLGLDTSIQNFATLLALTKRRGSQKMRTMWDKTVALDLYTLHIFMMFRARYVILASCGCITWAMVQRWCTLVYSVGLRQLRFVVVLQACRDRCERSPAPERTRITSHTESLLPADQSPDQHGSPTQV